ncbi:MAG: hypothetical protein K2P52_02510 [Campylobacterales bacterium]|nr:hypothetical protein [Campylobacterales bacterium]
MNKLILKIIKQLECLYLHFKFNEDLNKEVILLKDNKARIIILSNGNIGYLIAKSVRVYNKDCEILLINPFNSSIYSEAIEIDMYDLDFEEKKILEKKYNFTISKECIKKIDKNKKIVNSKGKDYEYSFLIVANESSFFSKMKLNSKELQENTIYLLEDVDTYPFTKNTIYTEKFLNIIIGEDIANRLKF